MEEILASIRRIIADDQAAKPEEAPPRAAPPLPENDDVLDLAEVAEPVRPAAKQPEPEETIDFDAIDFDSLEVEPDPPPPPPPPQPAPRAVRPEPMIEEEPAPRLTSEATDASVNQAFNMLAHTVLSQNARTLEDLVKDMLRPMLKAWLDDNLPVMVERMVRAEIERVSRGR
ncbi:MAG: DUF2497 domain-containing protein [Methylobacterium sp. CG08_land_8_20_14_0_20_71_15]|uniref:DUF2497 domain-containing protein n=4 Tax=Pseudomonadota TaxID=1224 RepID=A0ABQ4SRD2_9HYPH|nr:MAG: DUF2497 domain-containing protein [Methylobacterium sp. CG09_land_8_20_14_0_10_71_15]PIU11342.1 MAG: DUF2497 domain-containing protein [Methylobacterium sp. CG08_land_8_20_14_0_20_71_15]GJE05747.1 hypothetical protein AOPFMNJM_1053 [Methylobacterium jeotgali]